MAIQYRSGTLYRNSFTYDGNLPRTAQQFTAKARIIPAPVTISAKARILAPQFFTARTRISRQQGWPVPDDGDPGYALWQDTRLDSRARMSNYIAFPIQTLRLKGRVTYGKTLSMQAQARIVTAANLQMRANILPKFFTVHVPATFSVQQTAQRKLHVLFYTEGAVRTWQFTARARILQSYGSRVTGHFIVPMAAVFDTVLSIPNPFTDTRTQQTLSARAKVVK